MPCPRNKSILPSSAFSCSKLQLLLLVNEIIPLLSSRLPIAAATPPPHAHTQSSVYQAEGNLAHMRHQLDA